MNWITKLIINAVAILVAAYLLPGVTVDNVWTAFVVAIVLSILNILVKPLFIIITIPITIFTLGLFLLTVNAFMILLADKLVDGFYVSSFLWALIFSFLISIINSVLGSSKKNKEES